MYPSGPIVRRRTVRGFTLIELVIAMTLFAILASVGMPRAGEAIRLARIDRAARTVAVDLEQAMTMAARQRQPVRIEHPAGTRRLVVTDLGDGTVYSTTNLETTVGTGFGVDGMQVEPAVVDVYSTGQTSSALTVNLTAGRYTRTITMSPAGQIRVFGP